MSICYQQSSAHKFDYVTLSFYFNPFKLDKLNESVHRLIQLQLLLSLIYILFTIELLKLFGCKNDSTQWLHLNSWVSRRNWRAIVASIERLKRELNQGNRWLHFDHFTHPTFVQICSIEQVQSEVQPKFHFRSFSGRSISTAFIPPWLHQMICGFRLTNDLITIDVNTIGKLTRSHWSQR